MSEEIDVSEQPANGEVTDNDKMMALLAYAIPFFVAVVILLSETGKNRPFQRYHAVNSLVLNASLLLIQILLGCTIGLVLALITAGLGTLCLIPVWIIGYVVSLYYGIQAYQGTYSEIPFVTDFSKKQGWI